MRKHYHVDEMFDVREMYKHVAKRNDDYKQECDHVFWLNVSGQGLGLEMLSWRDEEAAEK